MSCGPRFWCLNYKGITLVLDDQGALDLLHLQQSNLQMLHLALEVDFFHLLQLFLTADQVQQAIYLLVSDLQSFLCLRQAPYLFLEPISLIGIIVDGCFVVFERPVFEIFGLLSNFLIFLSGAMLLSRQFVSLILELSHSARKGFGLFDCFIQKSLDVPDSFFSFGQLDASDIESALLFTQLNLGLFQLRP